MRKGSVSFEDSVLELRVDEPTAQSHIDDYGSPYYFIDVGAVPVPHQTEVKEGIKIGLAAMRDAGMLVGGMITATRFGLLVLSEDFHAPILGALGIISAYKKEIDQLGLESAIHHNLMMDVITLAGGFPQDSIFDTFPDIGDQ